LFYIFVSISLLIVFYLLFAKRKIDVFFISITSCLIFSIPLFLGYANPPAGYAANKIVPEVYFIIITHLCFLSLLMIANDFFFKNRCFSSKIDISISEEKTHSWIFFTIILSLLFCTIYIDQDFIFRGKYLKNNLYGSIIWTILTWIIPLVSIAFILTKKLSLQILAYGILILVTLMGVRAPFALVILSLTLAHFQRTRACRLIFTYPFHLIFFLKRFDALNRSTLKEY
jgi:hypothetical protein